MVQNQMGSEMTRAFLLSPAYCGGRRTKALLRPDSNMALAVQLREGRLTLGDAFAFVSGLYFRGKITYARAFEPDRTFIITPTRGLQRPDAIISADVIREFATIDIASNDERYTAPLARDLAALADTLPHPRRVVLLGSIATGKYVNMLADVFGASLLYPPSFIGRGDMSRGGLLLRSARSGEELEYEVLDPTAKRRGPRPPKLPPETRTVVFFRKV